MIRFKKLSNGNVLLTDETGNVKQSYSSPINVFKHPSMDTTLVLTDDASPQETKRGLNISFGSVDFANCEPPIAAANINELIEALSSDFFFRKSVSGGASVYQGEFLYNQDVLLYDGVDFAISYEGSTNQIKVNNKQAGWFDIFVRTTKGSSVNSEASDVSSAAGEHYLSSTGNADTDFALDNWYASHLIFRVSREDQAGKEIFSGEFMRAGGIINGTINKMN